MEFSSNKNHTSAFLAILIPWVNTTLTVFHSPPPDYSGKSGTSCLWMWRILSMWAVARLFFFHFSILSVLLVTAPLSFPNLVVLLIDIIMQMTGHPFWSCQFCCICEVRESRVCSTGCFSKYPDSVAGFGISLLLRGVMVPQPGHESWFWCNSRNPYLHLLVFSSIHLGWSNDKGCWSCKTCCILHQVHS